MRAMNGSTPAASTSNRSCSWSSVSAARASAAASAAGVPPRAVSSAACTALPMRASGITSRSGTRSTYLKWNSRGQRSPIATFEADHGAWISARVDGTAPAA